MTTTQKTTKTSLSNLTVQDVLSAYSGREGCCCCGCSGKHYHRETKADWSQIRRIFNIVTKNAAIAEDGGNNYAVVIGKRVYIVYYA